MPNAAIAIIVCPHCGKTSQKITDDSDLRCVECGMEYADSDAYMRREGRLQVKKDCTIAHKNRKSPIIAILEDISFNGGKIKYAGSALSIDSMLLLDVGGLDLHTPARVMWTHSMTKFEHKTGVKFVWPY